MRFCNNVRIFNENSTHVLRITLISIISYCIVLCNRFFKKFLNHTLNEGRREILLQYPQLITLVLRGQEPPVMRGSG